VESPDSHREKDAHSTKENSDPKAILDVVVLRPFLEQIVFRVAGEKEVLAPMNDKA
jgi:hypothetical protein